MFSRGQLITESGNIFPAIKIFGFTIFKTPWGEWCKVRNWEEIIYTKKTKEPVKTPRQFKIEYPEVEISWTNEFNSNGTRQVNILTKQFHYCRTEYRNNPSLKVEAGVKEDFHIYK